MVGKSAGPRRRTAPGPAIAPRNPATRQPGNPATRQPGNPATRQRDRGPHMALLDSRIHSPLLTRPPHLPCRSCPAGTCSGEAASANTPQRPSTRPAPRRSQVSAPSAGGHRHCASAARLAFRPIVTPAIRWSRPPSRATPFRATSLCTPLMGTGRSAPSRSADERVARGASPSPGPIRAPGGLT